MSEIRYEKIKELYIVGIGPGAREYILPIAIEVLQKSDIIIGFSRAIKSISFINTKKVEIKSLGELISYINKYKDLVISVIASGDPCFYGITEFIKKNYGDCIKIITGISSYQYFFSKLKKTWQNAYLGSLHGREKDFISIVKNTKTSFWLTDKFNTPSIIANQLVEEGINGKMYIGENLSYNDENIVQATFIEVVNMKFNKLCVIIIENEGV